MFPTSQTPHYFTEKKEAKINVEGKVSGEYVLRGHSVYMGEVQLEKMAAVTLWHVGYQLNAQGFSSFCPSSCLSLLTGPQLGQADVLTWGSSDEESWDLASPFLISSCPQKGRGDSKEDR